jgi:hypothetical protein
MIRLIVILLLTFSANAQQLSFPSAKGAGAYTTGGRGGTILHVTNLNWDENDTGSLKWALLQNYPRTIVFDVSGEIDATSESNFVDLLDGDGNTNYDNFTIAGQTAPEGGITVKTSFLGFRGIDNFIIRNVRFRRDDSTPYNADAAWFFGCTNYIVDHCTFSHGADETFDNSSSSLATSNVTLQNNLFEYSNTGLIMGTDSGGADPGDMSLISNLFIGISHRFPNPQGGGHYDIINNVVYNWRERLVRTTNQGTYNIINNYYKPAADGLRRSGWFPEPSDLDIRLHKMQIKVGESPLVYAAGSVVEGTASYSTSTSDDSPMFDYFIGTDPAVGAVDAQVGASYFTNTQFSISGESFTPMTANEAYTDLVVNRNVGAHWGLNADGTVSKYYDALDEDAFTEALNDTFTSADASFTYPNRSTYVLPTLPNNTRPVGYDTDSDGIPDTYEIAQGWNPNSANDDVVDASGYTQLELFLNEVDSENATPPTQSGSLSKKAKLFIIRQ